jgi:hypothetical protein
MPCPESTTTRADPLPIRQTVPAAIMGKAEAGALAGRMWRTPDPRLRVQPCVHRIQSQSLPDSPLGDHGDESISVLVVIETDHRQGADGRHHRTQRTVLLQAWIALLEAADDLASTGRRDRQVMQGVLSNRS